jgi:ribosome biogenesis protein MAK21
MHCAGVDKAESAWISTVLKSGTLTDKMSAYVVLVQSSPIHNLTILEQLIGYVTLKSRRPCLMAIGR